MATPVIGYGAGSAILKVNDGASSTQTPFSFPIKVSVPTGEVGKEDVSYMGMASRDRLFIPTLFDNGQLGFELIYVEADWRRLVALRGVEKTWLITFPDDGTGGPPTWSFAGFVTKYPVQFELDKVAHITVDVQVSGAITLA